MNAQRKWGCLGIGKGSIFKGAREKSVNNTLGQLWKMAKKHLSAALQIVFYYTILVKGTLWDVCAVPFLSLSFS